MKNILVTGSRGFVGTHLVKKLKKMGCNVRTVVRSVDGNSESIICNLGKDIIPNSLFESIDTVIHLAAVTHDVNNFAAEELYKVVNVDVTTDLAVLAVKNGVEKFIFISSVKAGGTETDIGYVSEGTPGDPDGVYGRTKREAEIKLLDIGVSSDMEVAIIRPALIYGPGVKGNLELMLKGIKKGWFPPLPETNNLRSMIHLDDLIDAIILVATNAKTNGEIYIATDGKAYSSREIYEIFCKVSGKKIPNWKIPKIIFTVAALISPSMRYRVNKLLGTEHYSSEKLQSIGFNAKKSLKDINETFV